MKLIIDISESTLILLRESGVDWLDAEHILSAVAHGIPLDSVKAKIEKSYNNLDKYYPFALCTFKNIVREILDNIGKAESEGEV